LGIIAGTQDGVGIQDDFEALPLPGTQTTEIAWAGKYKVFADTGGYVKADETFNSVETSGGILAFTADTDDDSASLATESEPFRLSGVASTSGKLWFEARVATSSIATNGIGFFVGLAENQLWTLAGGVPFNASDAITNSAACIGFHYPEDDTTTADTVYSDRATSFTKVGDGEVTGIAANTWVKLGFRYDLGDSTETITYYQNGVPLTTKTSTSTLTGLTNLDAGTLGLLYAHIVDASGTAIISYMDWWRCYQLAPA
jgi:hypothetical protein